MCIWALATEKQVLANSLMERQEILLFTSFQILDGKVPIEIVDEMPIVHSVTSREV